MAVGGVELATAYVSIVPSTRGLGASVAKEFGQVEKLAGQTGSRSGSAMSGMLGKSMKAGAIVAGGAITTVLGGALVKGFSRLKSIEQAQMKLSGLGMTAKQVAGVMKNAENAVLGTAYGLDEAATISASLIAAGVKPGKALETTLRDVASAATITGASLTDIGLIWGKVAATGKLQGDEMMQLTERGVPILSLLAKHYKVTSAEAAKMVSKGKVDFKTFGTVMKAYVGDAASKSGQTFTGAMQNLWAALGRLGQRVLGGVFKQMPTVFMDITKAIDKLKPAAEKIGEALGRTFERVVKAFKEWAPVLKPIGKALGELFSGFGPLQMKLGPITTLLTGFGKAAGKVGDWVTGLAKDITKFAEKDLPLITYAIVRALPGMIDSITKALVKMIPAIVTAGITLLTGLVQAVIKIAPIVLDGIIKLVNALVALLPKLLPPLLDAAVKLFLALVQATVKIAPTLINGLTTLIDSLIELLPKIVPALLKGAITLFTALVDALPKILPALVTATTELITSLVEELPKIMPALLQGAIDLFMAFVNAIPKILTSLTTAVTDLILGKGDKPGLAQYLPKLMSGLIAAAVKLMMAFSYAIPLVLPAMMTATKELITAYGKLLPLLGPLLTAAIASAFADAISSAMSDLFRAAIVLINTSFIIPLNSWLANALIVKFQLPLIPVPMKVGKPIAPNSRGMFGGGWAEGGFTGPGSKWQPAGVVHAGEYVINRDSTNRLLRQVPWLLPSLNGYAYGGWVNPVPGYKPAFPWGRYPSGGIHRALDYAVPVGTPVHSPYSGTVYRDGWDAGGFGVHVRVANANKTYSILGHLSREIVRVGQFVAQNQVVGYSGNTGNSKGPHLHWELRTSPYGPGVNPMGNFLTEMRDTLLALLKQGLDAASERLLGLSQNPDLASKLAGGIGTRILSYMGDKLIGALGLNSGGSLRPQVLDSGGLLRPGISLVDNRTGKDELLTPASEHDWDQFIRDVARAVESGSYRGTSAGLNTQARELTLGAR